jgi:hypothetical protein
MCDIARTVVLTPFIARCQRWMLEWAPQTDGEVYRSTTALKEPLAPARRNASRLNSKRIHMLREVGIARMILRRQEIGLKFDVLQGVAI